MGRNMGLSYSCWFPVPPSAQGHIPAFSLLACTLPLPLPCTLQQSCPENSVSNQPSSLIWHGNCKPLMPQILNYYTFWLQRWLKYFFFWIIMIFWAVKYFGLLTFVESKDPLVPIPLPWQGHLPLTRLLKALSNLSWNTSRDAASATSLGTLWLCLTTLNSKEFFPST